MTSCVVDASVVSKLYFQEDFSEECVALFSSRPHLLAPGLLWAEVANVAWKRRTRGQLSREQADFILTEAMHLPIEIAPIEELIHSALRLAVRTGRTVYDCLYLALALDRACPFITADRRLVNALAGGPLKSHVAWIGRRR
ncbi:MAG TPA: type II toxin-antitoxin system VapC family toxin [Phycisphaerae bacterium]|nr:type II toxin-antitoxin system VapC family toxin [Phycisphaerae bacterium]